MVCIQYIDYMLDTYRGLYVKAYIVQAGVQWRSPNSHWRSVDSETQISTMWHMTDEEETLVNLFDQGQRVEDPREVLKDVDTQKPKASNRSYLCPVYMGEG